MYYQVFFSPSHILFDNILAAVPIHLHTNLCALRQILKHAISIGIPSHKREKFCRGDRARVPRATTIVTSAKVRIFAYFVSQDKIFYRIRLCTFSYVSKNAKVICLP